MRLKRNLCCGRPYTSDTYLLIDPDKYLAVGRQGDLRVPVASSKRRAYAVAWTAAGGAANLMANLPNGSRKGRVF